MNSSWFHMCTSDFEGISSPHPRSFSFVFARVLRLYSSSKFLVPLSSDRAWWDISLQIIVINEVSNWLHSECESQRTGRRNTFMYLHYTYVDRSLNCWDPLQHIINNRIFIRTITSFDNIHFLISPLFGFRNFNMRRWRWPCRLSRRSESAWLLW
jgi:hypothetical protein